VIDFYKTHGGRRFIDGTIPDLVLQMRRIADALQRLVAVVEDEGKPEPDTRPASPPEGT
jgi:hypothetical protein